MEKQRFCSTRSAETQNNHNHNHNPPPDSQGAFLTEDETMEKVCFFGRSVGAIGGTYKCYSLVPMGSTESEARSYLSDRYEHIQFIVFMERGE